MKISAKTSLFTMAKEMERGAEFCTGKHYLWAEKWPPQEC
jgi:hypothetical protein